MGTTKDIKIFKFYDIHGEKFDACLCESVEINFRENPQYSIVIPKEDPNLPGERIYQLISAFTPELPKPPSNHFYVKLDFKRHTRADSGLADVKPGRLITCVTKKRRLELLDDSDFSYCYDAKNLDLLVAQNVVRIVREIGKNDKSRFILVELRLRSEEMMRRCEACLTGKYEIAGEENARYKLCGGCISQKVYYCGKVCQKGTLSARHLVSSEAHWTGNGGLFDPAHKVVCGKKEQLVREITQAARRKCCLALGWVGAAAESVQNWRTYG